MPRIDLITGFLGSGKTTFLKLYAQYLIDSGLRIGILENDYGAVNVDMMLLRKLPEDRCELEMVAGGCDYDCHKRRFKTKLIAMGMSGYDVVLVEPSGLYDVDEFFDTLTEEPLDRWYTIGNVISILDAQPDPRLSASAQQLLASQLVNAGMVVLSRVQEVPDPASIVTAAHLNALMERCSAKREHPFRDEEILARDWRDLSTDDFLSIASCGSVRGDHLRQDVDGENIFSSLTFMNHHFTPEQLKSAIQELFQDPERYGKVIRVKGFVKTAVQSSFTGDFILLPEERTDNRSDTDNWLEINATRHTIHTAYLPDGQDVIIVIGEGLHQETIEAVLAQAAGAAC